MTETVVTESEEETAALAARFAAGLPRGAFVLLRGDLGAGKTVFVRGMAAGLGIDPAEVSSPTFALIQEYRGARTLVHVDLYRIEGAEVDDLGLDELAGDVVAVEWAGKLPRPPAGAAVVDIADEGGNRRRIQIAAGGGEGAGPTRSGSSALPS